MNSRKICLIYPIINFCTSEYHVTTNDIMLWTTVQNENNCNLISRNNFQLPIFFWRPLCEKAMLHFHVRHFSLFHFIAFKLYLQNLTATFLPQKFRQITFFCWRTLPYIDLTEKKLHATFKNFPWNQLFSM